MVTVLLIVLVLLAVGALPHWPHTTGRGWGYAPSGVFAFLLLLLVVYLLVGHRGPVL